MLIYIFGIVITYLIGSLSSAIIICRLCGLPDPRQHGSNNPGATNVMRLGGKLPALFTLLGDGCKGFVPTLIAVKLLCPVWVIAAVMIAAVVGHVFPIFFGFKGGKGVATVMGAYLGLSWVLGLILISIWGGVILVTRVSSLGAIVATVLAPVIGWLVLRDSLLVMAIVLLSILLLWRHRSNIERLLDGKEK